jgi:hypothetical protein
MDKMNGKRAAHDSRSHLLLNHHEIFGAKET